MRTRRETTPRHPGDVTLPSHASVGVEQARTVLYISSKLTKINENHDFSRFFKNSPKIMTVTEKLAVDTSTAGRQRIPGTARDLCY